MGKRDELARGRLFSASLICAVLALESNISHSCFLETVCCSVNPTFIRNLATKILQQLISHDQLINPILLSYLGELSVNCYCY